jgi:hypothetical protein
MPARKPPINFVTIDVTQLRAPEPSPLTPEQEEVLRVELESINAEWQRRLFSTHFGVSRRRDYRLSSLDLGRA